MVCQCQSLQKLQFRHEDMKKAYKFDLEVKGQHRMGNLNHMSYLLMVIDQCTKFGMPMSKLTEVTGRTLRHEKSL